MTRRPYCLLCLLLSLSLSFSATAACDAGDGGRDCASRVEAFLGWVGKLEAARPVLPPAARGVKLAAAKGAAPVDASRRAPTVAVWRKGVELDGGTFDPAAAGFEDKLRKLAARNEILRLAVDREAGFARVAAVCAAARKAGFQRAALLVEGGPDPALRPARSKIDARLASLEEGDVPGLFRILADVVSGCPQAREVLDGIARTGEVNPRAVGAGFAEALLACGCQADFTALKAALHKALAPPRPGAIAFRLGGGENAVTIDAPDRAWAKVAAKVAGQIGKAGGRAVVFEVE